MSILMEVFSNGKSIGRCDAKCYNAKTKTCHCVCRGYLHGKGRNVAVRKLRALKPYFLTLYYLESRSKIKFF